MLGRVIRSPSMLQLLLERGILDLNCPSINDLMASAVDAANAVLLQILHDKGVALRMSARPGKFRKIHTLEAAIREGCQTVVTYLFSKGLSPKPGRYLEHAVYAKDPETANAMIDLLLRHGTDPNKMNDTCSLSGCTREYCACNRTEDQQIKVVRVLLDKGANPLPESSKWARDTLRRAARKEHTKVVRLLLQAINDTHGVSLDDVQRNLRCVENLYSQFQGGMKKFWRTATGERNILYHEDTFNLLLRECCSIERDQRAGEV